MPRILRKELAFIGGVLEREREMEGEVENSTISKCPFRNFQRLPNLPENRKRLNATAIAVNPTVLRQRCRKIR